MKHTPEFTQPELPYPKLCECGCGQPTNTVNHTATKNGYKKGDHYRYLPGHNPTGYRSVENYFWSHCIPGDTDDCWEWQSTTLICNGYGAFHFKRKKHYIHRVSWELHNKQSIPKGMQVCHECDNKKCWNPQHLFLGTNQDNVDDKVKKGRQSIGEQIHWAKLTADNVVEMRNLYAQGLTYQEIANRYGVCLSVAYEAIRRVTWKHVE